MFKVNEKPKKIKTDDFEINTVIAEDISIEGDLVGEDSIRIDGKVKGNIYIQQVVVIGESGLVEGNVQSERIIIFGKIIGNVHSQILNLRSSGHIDGDVLAGSLSVESGARIHGLVDMNQEKAPVLLEQKIG